ERARALYANAEALAHFRTALALGYPDTAKLHEATGDLLTLTGDYGAAASSYELAAARVMPARLGTLELKLGNLYARHGAWDLAESHLEAALAVADETAQDGDRARVLAA